MRFMVCLAAATAGACDPAPSQDSPCHDLPVPPGGEGAFNELMFEMDADGNPCPPTGCPGNSPLIAGVYFWRLHLPSQANSSGDPNPEGVRITEITKDGVPVRLELVDGDRLRVVGPMGADSPAGTRLVVSVPSQGGLPEEYAIYLQNVSREPFWVPATRPVDTYDFFYQPIANVTALEPLCSDAAQAPADPDRLRATVFGGERYDPVTKKITVGTFADGWINIACAGGAPYKMHQVGHTLAAASKVEFETSPSQRQAMLHAWTSNVCGSGTAFTVQGEEITLRESLGRFDMHPYNEEPVSIEAIWDENGAVCLNEPRRYVEEGEAVCAAIHETCDQLPPPCTEEQLASWQAHGHVLTGNRQ
jgi:hypothetical protein